MRILIFTAFTLVLGRGLVAQSLPQSPFLTKATTKTAVIPPYTAVSLPSATATSTVNIYPKDTLKAISKYLFGTNANQYSGTLNNESKLVTYIKQLQPNLIRYPGGLHSDEYFWNVEWDWNLKTPSGQTGGYYKNLPKDLPPAMIKSGKVENIPEAGYWIPGKGYWTFALEDYYDFLQKTGTEGLITVNYGYARYGTGPNPVATAAHLAADWVRYDKGRTKFWEIGNENVASWSGSYQIIKSQNKDNQAEILTPALYGQHCKVFIDSMKKAAKEVGAEIFIGIQNDVGALAGAGDSPDWLLDHTYYTNYNENSTVEAILQSPFAETKKYADKAMSETTIWKTRPKPTTMTEWNIFAVGSKQAASYINGMHLVLVLGEMMKNGYAMATRWDIANGWENGNDHGMFSSGDDPDGKTYKWNPRPAYFYQYYLQKFLGNYLVKSEVEGNSNVVTYASTFTDGKVGLALVNTSRKDEVVAIKVPTWKGIKRFYQYALTGGTDNGDFSLKVSVNGNAPSTQVGGPIDKLESINAQSALVYSTLKINVPKLSTHFLLLEEGENVVLDAEKELENNVRIYPNPTSQKIVLEVSNARNASYQIIDLQGTTIQTGVLQQTSTVLDLPHTKGVLILKIFINESVITQKIILE